MSLNQTIVRTIPLLIIVFVAVFSTIFLTEVFSFSVLRDNRAELLIYRDTNYWELLAFFLLIYFFIVVFSIPGATIASVSGGFLFGLVLGTFLSVFAATVGAYFIFVATKRGLGERLSSKIDASEGKIKRISQKLHENEISVLLLIRLVPIIPFFVANLLPALVGVRSWNFFWTTAIGIIPGVLVYTSIGVGVGEVFDRGEAPSLNLFQEPLIILPLVGICLLIALSTFFKVLRN
ncbi:MAG: VTT domain-containing protein [Aestuariivita sp.]|nr:VTT domain-containing protein [Aestuariivita sp.]